MANLSEANRTAALLWVARVGESVARQADYTYWRAEDHPRAEPYRRALPQVRNLYVFVRKCATVEQAAQAIRWVNTQYVVNGVESYHLHRALEALTTGKGPTP